MTQNQHRCPNCGAELHYRSGVPTAGISDEFICPEHGNVVPDSLPGDAAPQGRSSVDGTGSVPFQQSTPLLVEAWKGDAEWFVRHKDDPDVTDAEVSLAHYVIALVEQFDALHRLAQDVRNGWLLWEADTAHIDAACVDLDEWLTAFDTSSPALGSSSCGEDAPRSGREGTGANDRVKPVPADWTLADRLRSYTWAEHTACSGYVMAPVADLKEAADLLDGSNPATEPKEEA